MSSSLNSNVHNCLTVDVEDWFHICGVENVLPESTWDALPSRVEQNTRDLIELLDRARVRATFFVLGWVAARFPQLVAEIVSAGHEIGSHGDTHRRVYELSPQSFSDELETSRARLIAAGAPSVRGFRAPEWSINDRSLWALDVLVEKKFAFDSSMTPLRLIGNPSYPQVPHRRSVSGGELLEFPPLVARRFGQNMPIGGGWGLRMSRPARVLAAVEAHNKAGAPAALFVHPWEIDPDPPQVTLPRGRAFAHYFRLSGFKQRLDEIVRGASFAPMGEVLQQGSWALKQ